MASHHPGEQDDVDEMLAADDAAEEIEIGHQDGHAGADADDDADADVPMDSDAEEELVLRSDAIAYFDLPRDSLFAIAQHPVHASLVAVGGSAGPEDDAPGAGYLLDTLFSLDGHTDSINALAWTLPRGDYLLSGGLDGRVKAWRTQLRPGAGVAAAPLGEAREVDEVNWIAPCPSPRSPDTFAVGASDGSVWVYAVDAPGAAGPLRILQSYFLHTGPCTAGAWTPDGRLLATVSEDASLYVWDVFGDSNGGAVVSLTGADQRFQVPGGLYSVAVDPRGAFVAVGGAAGAVKVVSLPRPPSAQPPSRGAKPSSSSSSDPTAGGGQILASLHTQSDSIESLAISLTSSAPPTTLLAAGSVDGSICVYDATRRFAVRRHISGAHEEHSVVELDFVNNSWLLTSCGMDGVVRRWDLRSGGATGTNAAGATDTGLHKEWRGHRGDGEGGGVLGFVQGGTGERIVTAGDDGVSLVFEA
ncbi:hypothetical protein UVI_02056610 [Ustilaginoidea virens]|uniref:Uncharacterized protein n=1 Tax=Ustilaginoidea virens TaxID=1159556 RepID=A0A1B5KXR7_USTVR|nr:hypothetical protein UVI_02056610 [Ustilaginoidea virens]